ncbi:CDP-diacylglycerol--glycerol-3-phosphate 3-phosphatidyltransferase [Halocaridina rubra]|uniref:CDP-diacylglycerol--glycerol-3-phosphate 3-phosphatidyltransferase n=1 Tax=Halocaridina rubra TaxID=373956 RepID=A0AAN8XPM5_HALRR
MGSTPRDMNVKSALGAALPFLPKKFQWLLQHCPVFPINGAQVRVLRDPSEFYAELLLKASRASERISMSSLYLGTGKLEENLVSTMLERASRCENLCIHWLLDFTRGSRGTHNSRTMLMPLLTKFPRTCSVSLYHTPDLRGLWKWILPQRWNEIIGLQHMKLYVFDNSLVISGANLSNDYFTNRQDRFVAIDNCPELAEFYHRLIGVVSKFSLCLQNDNSTTMLQDVEVHPFLTDYSKYCSAVKSAVEKLWREECSKNEARLQMLSSETNGNHKSIGTTASPSQGPDKSNTSPLDTLVFPTVEMGPFGVINDSLITNNLFTSAERGAKIQLASGYFNLTEEYKKCILEKSESDYGILMAHPKANGFLGANGVSGGIPAAYTLIAKRFFEKIYCGKHEERIALFEYERPLWTFHGKGLWYYQPGASLPCLTMIGSPNFGRRSVHRDLESQVVIVTGNTGLQSVLHQEQQYLYSSASLVTRQTFSHPDRLVPLWVRFVIPIVKLFM